MEEKILKSYIGQIKDFDETSHTATVVVSTKAIDRDQEIIEPDAFKKRLKEYKKHPVLLSSHSYSDLRKQIGEAKNIKVNDEGLEAKFEWYVGQGNEEADWGWFLATKGIAAFSVGFLAYTWEEGEWDSDKREYKNGFRRRYTDIELLEISQVLIPSNREAVMSRLGIAQGAEKELIEVAIKTIKFADDVEMKPEPEETEDYIRIRIRNPDLFVDGSFRTIWFSEEQGIKSIIGKLKSDPDGATHIQSMLFSKEKGWTKEKAQEWVEEHKEDLKSFDELTILSKFLNEVIENKIKAIMPEILKAELEKIKQAKTKEEHYSQVILGDTAKKPEVSPTIEDVRNVLKEVIQK